MFGTVEGLVAGAAGLAFKGIRLATRAGRILLKVAEKAAEETAQSGAYHLLRAGFAPDASDPEGSGEDGEDAPDGLGLLFLAGLSRFPRRGRGINLGPLSNNGGNVPRLAGPGPNTPLLTGGEVTAEQILKTDAPHLNAELAARLATKEGGPDYAKRLDAISLLSENGNAGRGAAGVIDASAISGGVAARADVSPNKPVTPIDDSKKARVTANASGSGDASGKVDVGAKTLRPGDLEFIGPLKEIDAAKASNWTKPDGSIWWPPNNGALPGTEKIVTLQKCVKFGRIGGDGGSYVAPPNTPPDKLALKPGTDMSIYNGYKVIIDISEVQQAEIAKWFDMPGRGIQYKLPASINDLIDGGYIELMIK